MSKVSIIIPVYNVEKYISKCLDSVLNQTYNNIEIICVDDCGNDHSMEIVYDYQKRIHGKIKIVKCNGNKGLGAARDLGIKNSTGKYLTFLDSDDHLDYDCIQRYVSSAESDDADVVIAGYIREKDGKFYPNIPKDKYDELWMYSSSCHKLYKKEFLEKSDINFRSIRRYEDEQFSYRVLLAKPKISVINYAGYYYVYNSTSITQSKKNDRTIIFEEYLQSISKFWAEIKATHIDSRDKEIFEYCVLSKLIACFLFNAKGCGVKRMNELYAQYNKFVTSSIDMNTKNVYVMLNKKLIAEDVKTHYATWLICFFRRFRMDKLLFLLDSLL